MKRLTHRLLQGILSMLLMTVSTWSLAEPGRQAPVVSFGDFSNEVVHDAEGDPHVSGYSLVLFRQQDRLFGNFYATDGLAGDPPNGRIENVRFDPRSKRISFTARLTTGSDYDAHAGTQSPSRDWFEFSGRLRLPSRLSGTLVHKDGKDLARKQDWRMEKIVLKKRSPGYAPAEPPKRYEDWLASPLSNGPQW